MRAEKINAPQGITVALQAPALPWVGTSRTAELHRAAPAAAPDPEVPAKTARRRFTADRKLRILKLADVCTVSGSLGALLRREGLYSSNLTGLATPAGRRHSVALTPKKRGRKAKGRDPLLLEATTLRKENAARMSGGGGVELARRSCSPLDPLVGRSEAPTMSSAAAFTPYAGTIC